MHPKIKEAVGYMREGALVLTVNKRLARQFLLYYDRSMMDEGFRAWETPQVMPFGSWAGALAEEAGASVPVLSPAKEAALWRRAVSECPVPAEEEMLLRDGIAAEALDAYALINEYSVALPDDIYLTKEALYLKRLISSYKGELRRLGCIDRFGLIDAAVRLVKDGAVKAAGMIVLSGFDELTPKGWTLINAAKGRGTEVRFWPSPLADDGAGGALQEAAALRSPVEVTASAGEREEAREAARWARSVIRPGQTVGFIVPQLERYRAVIEDEFGSELDPASALPWESPSGVFNISLGGALYGEPLVKSALDVLSITGGRHDIADLSAVLMSPFIASGMDEHIALARIDAALKEDGVLEASLADIRKRFHGEGLGDATGFRTRLETWIKDINSDRKKKSAAYWADNFNNLLKSLGWGSPMGLSPNSREYQALEAWKGLLEAFSGLDDVLGGIGRSEALSHLRTMAKETLHQPEAPECAIQVLGPLEASGMYFDHVWIMGAHEESLPSPASPNPFIPVYIQKRYNLPHSSHQRELDFAKRLLGRIFESSGDVRAGYPLKSDEKERKLSPLLAPFCAPSGSLCRANTSRLKDAVLKSSAVEEAPQDGDIPVEEAELKAIKGGASILKEQSACPFRAFALFRLDARGVLRPQAGLRAEEKGTALHAALKNFWERVKDSERLKKIIEKKELSKYIDDSADAALKAIKRPQLPAYMELERERICALMNEWVKLEAKRPYFMVKEVEARREIDLGGLRINARIDRIDEGSGARVILDYKTGRCDRNDWLTDRPKEPQLLLYSLSGEFDAISFASINVKGVKFSGISRDEKTLPGIDAFSKDNWRLKMEGVEDWDDLRKTWKDTLLSLAKDFINGKADVDPNPNLKGNDIPCTYCELETLCRIFEADTGLPGKIEGEGS